MTIKTEKNHTASRPHEEKSALRQALPQILAVCVKNVLLLGFGMTLGFPTILIPSLSGNGSEEQISLDSEAISWIGSINLICVPVGCLMSGAITQPLGRKRAMQLVNIPFLTAWLLFHFSTDAWHVFLALCITGISGGLLEAPTLTYVAEITQPSLRGILASTSSIAVILGILTSFFLGTFFSWRTVALVSCVAPIISFTLLFFVPESPHWLISKDRFSDAQNSIAWLRGWVEIEEIQVEFQELCRHISKVDLTNEKATEENVEPTKCSSVQHYTKKSFLWPFSLVSFTFLLGHFSGMTTLQTYAVKIFSTLRAPIDKYYATIVLGVVEVLGCTLSAITVHYVGKRVLNFFSLIGCGTCFLIVAMYAYLNDVLYLENANHITPEEENVLKNERWVPLTFLVASAFFTHAGIRILPWMLLGEVYSNETRATGSGLTGGLSYIFGFISNKIFLSMIAAITLPGTFWFYSAFSFVGVIIIYFVLPETEGKTLFEITEHFAGNLKLTNRVYREKKRVKSNGVENRGFVEECEDGRQNSESRL